MGVYIPNMEHPKDSCWNCKAQYNSVCSLKREHIRFDGILDDCPLIEIVRCEECKWWDRKDKESPFGYCHAEKHCHISTNWEISIYRTYKADHFCADGERRADE